MHSRGWDNVLTSSYIHLKTSILTSQTVPFLLQTRNEQQLFQMSKSYRKTFVLTSANVFCTLAKPHFSSQFVRAYKATLLRRQHFAFATLRVLHFLCFANWQSTGLPFNTHKVQQANLRKPVFIIVS